MTEMLKTIAALMMALALASCLHSEPTLDASNPTAYQTSLARMKDELAPARRKALDEALISIVMDVSGGLDRDVDEDNPFGQFFADALPRVFNTAMAANPNRAAELVVNSAGNLIHGKTADEIIRLAKEKQLERLAAQLAKLDVQMAVLPEQIENAQRARTELERRLSRIEIGAARYYWSESSYTEEPVIDFTIRNNLDIALARVFFHGVLETPGRSVPWVDDSFNYSFRGGLEPGEKQHLRLVPNRFGDWGHEDLRTLSATILTVRVIDAEMASGDRLADKDGDDIDKLRDDLTQLESARKDLQDKIDRLRAELAVAS